MLKVSLISFALALVAIGSGIAGTAGISFELGRFLFLTLLGIAIATFAWALLQRTGPRTRPDETPP